jgi:putrescine transport system permease protein
VKPTAARALQANETGRLGPLWTFLFRYGPPRWTEYVLRNWSGQRLVIAVPYLWLLVFFLVPFLIVLKISFAEFSALGRPPYEPVFDFRLLNGARKGVLQVKVMIGSYFYLFNEPLYVSSWLYSIKVAFFSTVMCLLLGYPMAYAIARSQPTYRNLFLMLVILPFWTSFLLRVYAWIGLLKNDGVINNVLQWLGIIDEPLAMMNTSFAVYIGIVYSYLPFMILPLYSNLEKTRSHAARGGAGPGCRSDPQFPAHHAATVVPRRGRRVAAGVHPGGGRVRHPVAAGPHRPAHDRQAAVGRVLSSTATGPRRAPWPS